MYAIIKKSPRNVMYATTYAKLSLLHYFCKEQNYLWLYKFNYSREIFSLLSATEVSVERSRFPYGRWSSKEDDCTICSQMPPHNSKNSPQRKKITVMIPTCI